MITLSYIIMAYVIIPISMDFTPIKLGFLWAILQSIAGHFQGVDALQVEEINPDDYRNKCARWCAKFSYLHDKFAFLRFDWMVRVKTTLKKWGTSLIIILLISNMLCCVSLILLITISGKYIWYYWIYLFFSMYLMFIRHKFMHVIAISFMVLLFFPWLALICWITHFNEIKLLWWRNANEGRDLEHPQENLDEAQNQIDNPFLFRIERNSLNNREDESSSSVDNNRPHDPNEIDPIFERFLLNLMLLDLEFQRSLHLRQIEKLKIVNKIMMKHWKKKFTHQDKAHCESCCVCLDEMKIGEDVISLKCNPNQNPHIFHTECIINWVKENRTCPMWRKDLIELIRDQRNNHDLPSDSQVHEIGMVSSYLESDEVEDSEDADEESSFSNSPSNIEPINFNQINISFDENGRMTLQRARNSMFSTPPSVTESNQQSVPESSSVVSDEEPD